MSAVLVYSELIGADNLRHTLTSLSGSSFLALSLHALFKSTSVRKRLSAIVRYWLWWLICLRFLTAFVPGPAVTVTVPAPIAHWVVRPVQKPLPSIDAEHVHSIVSESSGDVAAGVPSPATGAKEANSKPFQQDAVSVDTPPTTLRVPSLENTLATLWLFGVICSVYRAARASAAVCRLVRSSVPVHDHEAVRMVAELWRGNCPPLLLEQSTACTPFVAGWRRPVLVLPAQLKAVGGAVLRSVIAHELRHLQRGDRWLSLLPYLSRMAFWWLPPVALAVRECELCAEEDCDIAAVRGADREHVRKYGELLIGLTQSLSRQTFGVGSSSLSAAYGNMQSRLIGLKFGRRDTGRSEWMAVFAVALALCATIVSLKLAARWAGGFDPAKASPSYALVDLGAVNASESAAESISRTGDVAGYQRAAGRKTYQAFTYRDGSVRLLSANLGFPTTRAVAVNSMGDVALCADGLAHCQHGAVVTHDGAVYRLEAPPGLHYSVAVAINDDQTAAGYVYGAKTAQWDETRAAVWQRGRELQVGSLGGNSSAAYGLDSRGNVVGRSQTALGVTHAFLYRAGSSGMVDLGSLSAGANSTAYAINESGEIVGFSDTGRSAVQHAVVWLDGSHRPVDLGGLVAAGISKARAINDRGDIVGVSAHLSGGDARATLWKNGRAYDLNSLLHDSASGWVLRYATGVDNAGDIVGVGQRNGQTRGFLLHPAGQIDRA